MNRKKARYLGIFILVLGLLAGCHKEDRTSANDTSWQLLSAEQTKEGLEVKIGGENLLQNRKVKIEADSVEDRKYSVKNLTDGIVDDESLRWSSENNWEDSRHWVQIRFPQRTLISAVRLFWERQNVCQYSLEISEDGEQWTQVLAKTQMPEDKIETLLLDKAVQTTYLRLYVKDVNKSEEDFSLYYQNVSLLEMEVYGELKDEFVISSSCVGKGTGRSLQIPSVPEGYELQFLGAEHEALITSEGKVADTIAEAETGVGFSLTYDEKTIELPPMKVKVLASESQISSKTGKVDINSEKNAVSANVQEEVEQNSEINKEYLSNFYKIEPMEWVSFGKDLEVNESTTVEYQLLEKETKILGEEGFQLTIDAENNYVLIEGKTQAALCFGRVTYEKMLEIGNGKLPAGKMRDYPAYEVRGFGIDVGRQPVSMNFLYELVEALSKEKMNTLLVHLNDNQIITQSGYDGTMEGARKLYAGFRLESEICNKDGEGITSKDLFYTKEEFAKFISEAREYGVEVIPEIDTPGHSLALVKVFPELGIQNPETADLLDVSKKETRELVKNIWKEYLTEENGESAVFAQCDTLHIGMDEYFGKSEEYISYLVELSEYIKELAPEKEIRMWGSLTGMDCDYSEVSKDISIQLWSTDWANPEEMYQAGFDIINSQNTRLYLVPGTGYDRLDTEYLKNHWEPNIFENSKEKWEIPSYSSQMQGACYMLWNDMVFHEGMDITEEEMFARFEEPLGIIADKLWR